MPPGKTLQLYDDVLYVTETQSPSKDMSPVKYLLFRKTPSHNVLPNSLCKILVVLWYLSFFMSCSKRTP